MVSSVVLCEAVLLLLHIFSSGMVDGTSITKEEYFQMKEHLKFLNRPAVKTIQTTYGDIFDCVNIYKQPSLDHPLLKNHTIQMRPSTLPKGIENEGVSPQALNIELKDGGCPLGTVPIQRIQMKDILRAASLSKFGKKVKDTVHHYAEVDSRNGSYYGTQATINIWNPRVHGWNKFSLSQMCVVAGPTPQLNSIEAGWIVYPRIFRDHRTRLFVYWTTDGYQQTGCYNLLCKGFVQVSRELPVGTAFELTSVYNGTQFSITLSIFKDRRTGDWWLTWGPNSKLIGYWPKSLFNFLNDNADKVSWGGEVSGRSTPPLPQMGSGHFPLEGVGKASFTQHIKIADQSHVLRNVDLLHEVRYYNDKPNCYRAEQAETPSGILLLFGGPGGYC